MKAKFSSSDYSTGACAKSNECVNVQCKDVARKLVRAKSGNAVNRGKWQGLKVFLAVLLMVIIM